jgi:hypothetical protein
LIADTFFDIDAAITDALLSPFALAFIFMALS